MRVKTLLSRNTRSVSPASDRKKGSYIVVLDQIMKDQKHQPQLTMHNTKLQ